MYGVYLSIHPSETNKYAMIHKVSCSSYKMHARKGRAKQIYSFNKDAKTFRKAIFIANRFSLDWHAPIYICTKCFPMRKKIECAF